MSKFNTPGARPATTSPIVTEPAPSTTTYEGGPGYLRDTQSELFLLAVSNMVGEETFYESARDRDSRYVQLVHAATQSDPQWVATFLRWLRTDGNMRSASIVGAAEYAKAMQPMELAAAPRPRGVVSSVLQRPDEPGELLAYWAGKYGRAFPQPIKRGVADAAVRLYSEQSLLKWDSEARGYRFGDVIDLVHPEPKAPWQSDLFRHAMDRRHNRDNPIPDSLPMLRARAALMEMPVADRRGVLISPAYAEMLQSAGMTWESLAGWLQGPMDRAAWESIIDSMGYMALLRNLRNFDDAGVSDELAAEIADGLADPAQVAKSRQFPMRFLSAYKAAPSLRWANALEKALNLSLDNVPVLPGRSLVLVDTSASMYSPLSARSTLQRFEAAGVFGAALASRAEEADLVQFGSTSAVIPFRKGESILRIMGRFVNLGGTNTATAVRRRLRTYHNRVIIVTDEQVSWDGDPTAAVPENVPVYTWNVAGYRAGHGPSGSGTRHTFGGLTDAAFRMVPLIEAGRSADWKAIFGE